MKQGRLSVLSDLTRLSFVTVTAFFCISVSAQAQQANPEIYVDMEVLEQLDPGMPQQQAPVPLRPPASQDNIKPRLTSPSIIFSEPLPDRSIGSSSGGQVSSPPSMPDDPERPFIPSVRLTEPVQESSVPPSQETVSFPIKTKIRSETNDPSVNEISRPVPVRSGIAGNIKDTVPSRPLPDLDPEAPQKSTSVAPVRDLTEKTVELPKKTATVQAKPVKLSKSPPVIPVRKPPQDMKLATLPVVAQTPAAAPPAIEKKQSPVIPSRRPDNVQKASPELIAQLRAREENKKHIPMKAEAVQTNAPLPPPGPMGRKNMPAVAKPHVEAEKLPEQAVKSNNDPLLGQLLEKDKEDLVATIESMVAEREDGKTAPADKKPKRQLGSNIVKAEPLQRPYNVYRPKKDGDETEQEPDTAQEKIEATQEIKVASLPVPARVAPRPRSPEEKAYISLPFATGLNEIDDKIIGEIETQLLPVLNNNPASKLQIHAFASPAKDNASSARKASLARAMSVRAYLISKGIEATRMNIRALGAESDREPFDRVDLIVFDPVKKS